MSYSIHDDEVTKTMVDEGQAPTINIQVLEGTWNLKRHAWVCCSKRTLGYYLIPILDNRSKSLEAAEHTASRRDVRTEIHSIHCAARLTGCYPVS